MATVNKALNTRVQHKNDIEANWIKAVNFQPLLGEIIVYRAETESDELPKDITDQPIRTERITYPRIKIGDGVNKINDLPFITDSIIEYASKAQKFYAEEAPTGSGDVVFYAVSLEDASKGVY